MTPVVANGTPGPGPAPLSAVASDRAGEEAAGADATATSGDGALERVLRALDVISAVDVELTQQATTAAEIPDVQTAAPGDQDTAAGASSARQEEILDAASALFAERGYNGASLRDISRRVGISHPGMLHHFSTKEVLLGAVVDRLEAHAQGLLDSVEALRVSPHAFLAALTGPWDPRGHQMALLATLSAEIVNPDHPGRFRIARLRLVHEHVLEQVLEGLAEGGHLVPGVDPGFLARTVFSELMSMTVREHTVRELQNTPNADPIDDVQRLVSLFLIRS